MKEQGADEAAIKKFQTSVSNYYTKTIGPNFKDYDFYVGESMDTDGMYVQCPAQINHLLIEPSRVVLLNYGEDGMTPLVTIWKQGLSQMIV